MSSGHRVWDSPSSDSPFTDHHPGNGSSQPGKEASHLGNCTDQPGDGDGHSSEESITDHEVESRSTVHLDEPWRDPLWLHEFVESAPDGILIVAGDGRIRYANRQAGEIFGYKPCTMVNMMVEELVPEPQRSSHKRLRVSYLADTRPRPMGTGLELWGLRGDGAEVGLDISLSPITLGGEPYVIAFVREVSELRLARDRERIARDLHDTVIQRLFATGMGLQAAATRVNDPMTRGRIERAIDDLDEVVRSLRSTIFALQAGAGLTLRKQILDLAAKAAEALGFMPHVHFHGPVDTGVPDRVVAELIPSLSEALSNVAKHANATWTLVRLEVAGEVTLTVSDNGKGIDGAALERATTGYGLRNLSARARTLKGECTIGHRPEGGAILVWHVPID